MLSWVSFLHLDIILVLDLISMLDHMHIVLHNSRGQTHPLLNHHLLPEVVERHNLLRVFGTGVGGASYGGDSGGSGGDDCDDAWAQLSLSFGIACRHAPHCS